MTHGQSHLQCIMYELQGNLFNSSHSAAICSNEVEFTPFKIKYVCINGYRNKQKMWIASQYADSGEVILFRGTTPTKTFEKMKSVNGDDCLS